MKLPVALFLTSVFITSTSCAIVDPNMYQYEVGPYVPDNSRISFPESNPFLYQLTPNAVKDPRWLPDQRKVRQLHPSPPKVPKDTSSVTKNINDEINDIIEEINKLTETRASDNQNFRAVDREDYVSPYPHPAVNNPSNKASIRPLSPQNYGLDQKNQEHPSQPKLSFLQPDLLAKSVASRSAFKIGGLIQLILALFSGSASGDSELTGFKDILINGIVRPLLTARGGLKAIISKISIPMIALMLINLEVLITVWWLWEEDCPATVYQKPGSLEPTSTYPPKTVYQAPSFPPSYNYNSYR